MTATRSTPRTSDPGGSPGGSSRRAAGDPPRSLRGEVLGDERSDRFHAFERRFSLVTRLFDDLVEVPGTRHRIGLDPIVGLIPVVGDAVSGVVGFWLIAEATRFGLPRVVVARMVLNTGLDVIVGLVPLVGDLFDIVSRSNARNLALFRRHALEPGASTRDDRLILLGLGSLAIAVLWLIVMAIGWLLAIEIPAP
ncbi:MAG TPA: DUF4112 domain-containing protein [Patescibacteria group bacterium]|nr:DUF4112 domain-containing protein [Patescibacteria group bacterium]